MSTILTITFENPEKSASVMNLNYRLYENRFVNRWRMVLQEALDKGRTPDLGGVFYGKIFYREEELRDQMEEVVSIINGYWPDGVTQLPAPNMDQAHLSRMHTEFENLERGESYLSAPEEVRRAVLDLNLYIHRYEQLFISEKEAHVDVLFHPVDRYLFEEEDYAFFDPNFEQGKLYLSYGVTGVPVLSAFWTDHPGDPVPQYNYSAGMQMHLGTSAFFSERERLKTWLEKRGMDIEDPKLALGHIPLGELILEDLDFEKIRQSLVHHQKIVKLEMSPKPSMREFHQKVVPFSQERFEPKEKFHLIKKWLYETRCKVFPPKPPPKIRRRLLKWPMDEEIFLHLQHTPWIFLPLEFDHQACFEEASRLLDRFVVHRNYDQSSESETKGKWKSLGIHSLNGDSKKTQYHKDYGVSEPDYRLSEIAPYCPKTLEFLNRLTRVVECERVRFMLLEPGARIHVHSDVKDRDWGMAINIALNMPEGCEFWTDLEPNGERNAFSRQIPIQPGQIFIFNNATYHSVVNHSDQPRIHLIVHGPLRLSDGEVIAAAREQNHVLEYKALVNQVVAKKALMGKEIPQGSKLHGQLMVAGLSEHLIPKEIALAVMEEDLGNAELQHEALHLVTKASLFPLNHQTVKEKDLDQWLVHQQEEGKKYAVVLAAGTHLPRAADFAIEVLRAIRRMQEDKAPLMGHLMNRSGEIPFLHEQLMILDLERWKKWGAPPFGRPYSGEPMEFCSYEASAETVHDDYTPLWLAPSEKMGWKKGKAGWGSRVIRTALESGEKVINVPLSLRKVKKFTYPRSGKQWQYQEVKRGIDSFLKTESHRVFVFNNEPLHLPRHKGFVAQNLLTPCSGLKPFALARQFCGSKGPEKVSFIDFSPDALEHYMRLLQVKDSSNLASVLTRELRRQVLLDDAAREAKKGLDRACEEAFDGKVHHLLETIQALSSKAEVEQVNYITQRDRLVEKIIPGRKTLFWHSNAFSSNVSFYLYSQEQLQQAYLHLGREVKKKLNCRAWIFKGGGEMIFGDDFSDPQVIFTHGYFEHPAQSHEFMELN